MIIVIPAEDREITTNVCISFGRAPYFLIYDTQADKTDFIDNSAAASSGGAGIKAAQSIVDNKAEILLTMRCGENAAEVLKAGNIKIYKTIQGTAMDNIKAYIDGKLSLLDNIHPGFHNHGGK